MEISGLPDVSAPLPWHTPAWSRFNQQLQGGTLPHALLLTGVQHSGKQRLALALARLLLCQAPSGGLNCGKCHACELSASGSHGDFRWLQPQEKSRVIKVDQVRELVDFANKTASHGQRKVAVLSPADSMNVNAANALLKSLEEPAPGTFLLLVCHHLQGVPATVRSRCQIVKLATPDSAASLDWLDQATGQRPESERLLALADGLPLLAEAIYRQPDGEERVRARVAVRALLAGKLSAPEVTTMLSDAPVDEALAQLAAGLHDLVRGLEPGQLCSTSGRSAFTLLDEIGNLERALRAGANPNRQMLLEAIVGKVQRLLGPGRTVC